MDTFSKHCIGIFLLVVCAFGLGRWMADKYPPDLVQLSIASNSHTDNLSHLWEALGLSPPPEGFNNPCYEAEQLSQRYCSVETLRALGSAWSCEQASFFIEQSCQEQNFIKIYKHFKE